MNPPNSARELLALLPAIYREDPFAGQYLWAFERVLLDLEQQVDDLAALFDPLTTRSEFLPWLASWMAFTLRADLDELQKRHFLANAISLYRRRGTQESLGKLVKIFAGGFPTISEGVADPAGDVPHHFHIKVAFFGDPGGAAQVRRNAITRALIEMEKPAHTQYGLELVFPTMRVGEFSTVGVDTLLGSRTGA
jgi:phage tail-like protein